MKVAAPDAGCRQVDGLTGRRYTARNGVFEMSQRDGRALVAEGGFLPSLSGSTSVTTGYRCEVCQFGSFFRRCSRCGGDCEREA
ncbi:hypothetical protein [Actinomadura harenae]|uniref:Uncharacterized protein n=1 Tax=Actinomadura harenae TaxID=2483351 RepID=A0A3M2MDH5_9ACTN|nr:hypothetical protein [Actinomadura harenae]RMI47602.1 hypothetical protein EBO15_01490 [Actinomadura harenae]